jgi:TolB-like protein
MVSERGRRFFRYVVEETLAGRGAYLKAYTIAQEVFGRGVSFDPQNDPCVRMAASQLRRSLERYYLVAGLDDGVLVTIPRGQYAPVFVARPAGAKMTADLENGDAQITSTAPLADLGPQKSADENQWGSPLTRWMLVGASVVVLGAVAMTSLGEKHNLAANLSGTPTVLVELFDDIGQPSVSKDVLHALADELVVDLSRSKELMVIAPDGVSKANPTYVLEGSVRIEDQDMRSIVRLVRKADGAVVWSGIYNVNTAGRNMLDVETTIARSISTSVSALRTLSKGDQPQGTF